jgi:uncharacterized protein YkwD
MIKKIFMILVWITFGVVSTLGIQKYQSYKIETSNMCFYEREDIFGYTGQNVFDAVNCYRKQQGLEPFIMDDDLCVNLGQRYFDYLADPKTAHAGFDKWADEKFKEGFKTVSENVELNQPSLKGAIDGWNGSPGHHLTLVDTEQKYACTYVAQGYALLVIGSKENEN